MAKALSRIFSDYLTTREAAEIIGIAPSNVRTHVSDGNIAVAAKVGTSNLFDPAEVERFRKIARPIGKPAGKYKGNGRTPKPRVRKKKVKR